MRSSYDHTVTLSRTAVPHRAAPGVQRRTGVPAVTTVAPSRPDTLRYRLHLSIGDVRLDRYDVPTALDAVRAGLVGRAPAPLAVASVNLDHLYHFGVQGQHNSALPEAAGGLDWMMLVDGSPVARRARQRTGLEWPRLTGADLLPQLLTLAEQEGARVGFLGGFPRTVPALNQAIRDRWPELTIAGVWTPDREVVDDPERSAEVAASIADADVDLLIVGLGKPRQERWIAEHGLATEARVLAAFGAAADFLAGSARRAPLWMRRAGVEWSYRLAREPRRLSRRYLVQGPVAMWSLLHARSTASFVGRPAAR